VSYDAFIFDLDGVLLDTRKSFIAAATTAVACFTGTRLFTAKEATRLKAIPGFNNDWHVAIAGAAWVIYFATEDFQTYLDQLDRLGGGLQSLEQRVPELTETFQEQLVRLTKEAYGGTTACGRLYGFEPQSIVVPGYWQTETPLVTPEQLQPYLRRAGMVTGRMKAELELGFERLGWSLPEAVVAWSDDPALDKPNPAKLTRIIENLGAQAPVYIGDTRDDLELVRNYRRRTGRPLDFCLVGEGYGLQGFDWHYRTVAEFLLDNCHELTRKK
jgi:phosphoglycolate phosphatase-like HAD superfamily hydrolase